nr:MAG: RNA-dependent RNA polymerase [Mononegavirales sp.]
MVRPNSATQQSWSFDYSRHLDSPLTQNGILFYINNPEMFSITYPDLPYLALEDLQSGFFCQMPLFPTLEKYLVPLLEEMGNLSPYRLQDVINIASTSVRWQVQALMDKVPFPNDRNLEGCIQALKRDPRLQRLYSRKAGILQLHETLVSKAREVSGVIKVNGLPGLVFQKDLVAVLHLFRAPVIITYDMLLCVLDKVEAQFTLEILLVLLEVVPSYEAIDFSRNQRLLYKLLDDMYKALGNKSHYVLKALEGCAVGVLLRLEPPSESDHQYLEEIINSFHDNSPEVHIWGLRVIELLHQWSQEYGETGRVSILEAYGQEKLHFYPIVDDEGGQLKMYSVGTSYREVDHEGCSKIKGYLVQQLVWSIYTKSKELPQIVPSVFLHEAILDLYVSGVVPSRASIFSIPPLAWAKVTFLRTMQFDYRPDNYDLMLDKSIAPDRKNINQLWHPDVRTRYKLQRPKTPSDRRFISWVMKQPVVDCETIFDSWERHKNIPREQTIILATAKEREQKNEARSYSILHPIPRIALTTIEYNLSESILPLLPFHSMSLSGPQLQKRIESFVRVGSDDSYQTIFFTLDYEQWNYTFRDRATFYFDNLFNQLYGVNHFKWPNKLFREATFLTGNPFTPPELESQFTTWDHHSGGNQGIRQKFWTVITQAAIGLAMEDLGYPYQLIGSGDNQVLSVKLPAGDGLAQSVDRVKTAIQEQSSALGISLKLAETFHSRRLFVYQRKYYSDGKPISLVIKGCTRFFAGSSDGAPTLANVISTSQNSGMQISSASGDPIIGILCGHIESYTALVNHPAWKPTIHLSPERMAAISLLSSDLMPLNFLQLPGYLYSGHKDMLTECLALINHIYTREVKARHHIAGACNIRFKNSSENWELALVLDPRAPNIDWPQSAESFVRDRLRHYLLTNTITKNRQMMSTFANLDKLRPEQFARSLIRMKPLNLSIVHSLFESSRTGQVLASVNRFSKARTIFKLTDRSRLAQDEVPLMDIIRQKDCKLVNSICRRVSGPNHPRPTFFHTLLGHTWPSYQAWCKKNDSVEQCSYNIRRYLVIKSYNLGMEDILGPYCPAPFEQITLSGNLDPERLTHSILVNPARTIPETVEECEYTRGPFSRYIGSATASRVQSYKFFKLSGGDMSSSINLLFSVGTWLSQNGGCPNLDAFVTSELNSRIPDLDQIYNKVKSTSRGGCLEHRFSSPGEVTGAYSSTLSLLSTHYRLNTDKASHFNRSEDDFELFFQPSFHYIHSILRFCNPLKTRVLAVIELDHCTRLITNRQYSSPSLDHFSTGLLSPAVHLSRKNRHRLTRAMESSFLASDQQSVFVPSRARGLIAYICEMAAVYIRKYQTYHQYSEVLSGSLGRPESVLNLSLMRGMDLREFLLSLVITLDHHGVFGIVYNKSVIAGKLHNWSRAISGIIDVNMFKFITDALSQIGELRGLCALARSRCRYIRMNRAHSLAPVLLLAMANVVNSMDKDRTRWTIISKEPGPPHVNRHICATVRKWCRSAVQEGIVSNDEALLEWARDKNFRFKEGQIITCNVVGTIEEISRSLPALELNPISYYQLRDPTQRKQLRIRLSKDRTSRSLLLDDRPLVGWSPIPGIDTGDRSLIAHPLSSRVYQIARWGGTVSGAWTKLALILHDYWDVFMSCQRGLFLAEGGGSMLSYCLHANPNLICLYNSLYEIEGTDGVEDGGFTPPALLCECDAITRVLNVPYLDKHYGDLTVQECIDGLFSDFQALRGAKGIVVCDIDTWEESRIPLFCTILGQAQKVGANLIVLKMFSEDFVSEELQAALQETTRFYMGRAHKPLTSNATSDETYIVFSKRIHSVPMLSVNRSLQVWSTIVSDLRLIPFYHYVEDLVAFCQEVMELPSCLDGSPISSANKHDDIKFTMPTIYEAFMIVLTLRRDLVGSSDLLSRELGVLFHSRSQGGTAVQENFWSLTIATTVAMILAGYTTIEIPAPRIRVGEVSFWKRVIPLLAKAVDRFSLPTMVDMTWRRIGYLFRISKSFGSPADVHFLRSIAHYTSNSLGKLRVVLTVPRALRTTADLLKREHDLRVQCEMPMMLFQSGLKMMERVFKNQAREMGTSCQLIAVSPAWMEDVIRSRDWPVTFRQEGDWGVVIGAPHTTHLTSGRGLKKIIYFHLPKAEMSQDSVVEAQEDGTLYEFVGAGLRWNVESVRLA